MALDAQITKAIEVLETEIYQDGNTPKKGTDALAEMVVVVKELVTSKKYVISEKLRFLNERKLLLQNYQTHLDDFATKTQIQQKYELFYKNSGTVLDISGSMDEINSNINLAMQGIIRKLRGYRREVDEIAFRITFLSDQLSFWNEATEKLTELEALL